MLRRTTLLFALAMAIGGCSYEYELLAVVRDGHVVFLVDPKSSSVPSCLRRIEVSTNGGSSSVWRDSVDYADDCVNKFPIPFGKKLTGRHQPDWPTIAAKPLRRGVVYEVTATTGATGYGVGHFRIDENGHVVNMPSENEARSANQNNRS